MKNILKILIITTVVGAITGSCKRDFLDTQPLDQISSSVVWTDAALAEAFVNEIYNGLGQGGFNEQMLASLTDEAMFTHAGRGINTINQATLNPSNLGWVNGTYEWGTMLRRIRATNVALLNLKTAKFDDKVLNERLQGEVHFLRAYFYHQLVRYYGGAPIITRVYELSDDFSIARNTFEECVNFIVKDCDSALLLIGTKSMAKGRANKLAVLALQSRILLYAASDLHDIPTAKANSSLISGFAKPELLGYLSGSRTDRWTKAKAAAKAVLDAGGGGYNLNLSAPVTADQGKNNYLSIAMGGKSKAPGADASADKEILFARYTVANQPEGIQQQGLYNGPNGYHNWAGNSPIQQLVDDYEMMDGTKFNWSNPLQKAAPYDNRDPRFYVSIMYDGAPWKPRDKISGNVDPANQIQTGRYILAGGTILPGLDTRQSSIENWNGSWSGYYMRKFTDPDPNLVDNNARQFIPWAFFRYTEAVFNYAEACIELGEDAEARTWLNKIRFRAGMPAITESGPALKDRYRNERRIEMVFEEQRFHDARRWMIAPATLGSKIQFISVLGTLKPGATSPSPYRFDRTRFEYTYTPVEDNSLENRKWDDKMYFLPFSKDEVNKNKLLVHNPGYQN
ncbi:MAG: RagB/SusD family nutrient uptake outer membrane protein [Chitinophagaceae bacterium]